MRLESNTIATTITTTTTNNSTAGIRSYLDSHHSKVIIQWIPGHSDVAGNELADSESRKAAVTTISEAEPTSLRAALSCIRRTFKDSEPCHHRAKLTYKDYNFKAEAKNITSKKDAVLLAQLRSGHCKLLKAYANLLDPTVEYGLFIAQMSRVWSFRSSNESSMVFS